MLRKSLRACSCLVLVLSASAAASPAFAADTPATTRPAGNPLASYQKCMKTKGVKLELPNFTGAGGGNGAPPSGFVPPTGGATPTGGGVPGLSKPKGVSTKKWNSAQKACSSKLPTFGAGAPNGANAQDFQAYRSCLSDHGVKLPSGGGIGNIDPNDTAFQEANKTCGALLPNGVTPGANAPTSTNPSSA